MVGVPMPVRVALEARGNQEFDSVGTTPTRSTDLARPQRAGRFQVTFDLPNPRPNGNMVVAVAIIGRDGLPIDGIRPAGSGWAASWSERPRSQQNVRPGGRAHWETMV